jgi:hypothetical protein
MSIETGNTEMSVAGHGGESESAQERACLDGKNFWVICVALFVVILQNLSNY